MAEIRWWWQPPYTENLEEEAQKECELAITESL